MRIYAAPTIQRFWRNTRVRASTHSLATAYSSELSVDTVRHIRSLDLL